VFSRGAGVAGPIRVPGRSWHAHDCPTAATASVCGRFGLEAESAALAGKVVTAPIIAPFRAVEWFRSGLAQRSQTTVGEAYQIRC
jgi:hypothetical protein